MGKKLKEADVKRQEKGTGSDQKSFPDSTVNQPIKAVNKHYTLNE